MNKTAQNERKEGEKLKENEQREDRGAGGHLGPVFPKDCSHLNTKITGVSLSGVLDFFSSLLRDMVTDG